MSMIVQLLETNESSKMQFEQATLWTGKGNSGSLIVNNMRRKKKPRRFNDYLRKVEAYTIIFFHQRGNNPSLAINLNKQVSWRKLFTNEVIQDLRKLWVNSSIFILVNEKHPINWSEDVYFSRVFIKKVELLIMH